MSADEVRRLTQDTSDARSLQIGVHLSAKTTSAAAADDAALQLHYEEAVSDVRFVSQLTLLVRMSLSTFKSKRLSLPLLQTHQRDAFSLGWPAMGATCDERDPK